MLNRIDNNFTFDEFCNFIDLYGACTDGYLYILDIRRDLYYISEMATERFAIPTNHFTNTTKIFRQFIHKDDVEWLLKDVARLCAGEKDAHDLDYRWLGKDGAPIWINCRGRLVKDADGAPAYMIGCVDEIGKQQRADNVSGLMGSGAIELDALFSDNDEGFCLHIGIDHFCAINQSFGMDYGDFILRAVANSIADALLPGQEVYRVVADEYFVIASQGDVRKDGQALYERIRCNVEHFVEGNGYEAVFTVSCGAVSASDLKNLGFTQALQLTQFSLSAAKANGKNTIYFFEEKDYVNFVRKRDILRAIKESVSDNFRGFEVFYQPIMQSSGEPDPYAAEALLRFRMRNGENISPYEFIPIIEESGLIIPVGKWVINEAMGFCQQRRQLYPEFRVSVNVSYVQVLKGSFVNDFFQLLEKHQLPPNSITIELTESGHVEGSTQIYSLWERLKMAGVCIALDDFGTGFSNLLYISTMTPNIIKLDRSFTVKALSNSFEQMLMTHTIQLVHSLGLKACVEGVETQEDLERVRQLGADYIQGYYYSKPCPKQEFMEKFS